ncbi:transcriptional regulator family: Centromere protein B, DNA-binding region [Penicillium roqueforti]|nr:transcriptional regulator family: Centromere protein B, DNA-binding region [Penicillium roqueforti]
MSTPSRRSALGISGTQKQALRIWAQSQNPRPSQSQCSAWFERTYGRNLSQSTISTILSKKFDHLDAGPASTLRRQLAPQWPLLETPLCEWLASQEAGLMPPADTIIAKAREIWNQIPEYQTLALPHFSNGWLNRFKKRYAAQLHDRQDGVPSPTPQNGRKETRALKTLCGEFPEDDIYNMDETGLFWRKPPFSASPAQNQLTTNRENSRICIMLCTNSTGSDRLPLWVIGHTPMPEALQRANLKAMDCHWRYHRQAWLTQSIMQEWLLFFYDNIGERRVLLLLDNHPDHQAAVEATPPPPNVHIQLFPTQTRTSDEQQPINLGISQTLKHYYRRQWLAYIVAGRELPQNPVHMMSLYHTISWATRSWRHDVANAIIYRAFRRSSLMDPQIEFITAPKSPDLTSLYGTATRNNPDGRTVISLENFIHPVDEDFEGGLNVVGFVVEGEPTLQELDDAIVSIPPEQLVPPAVDAVIGIQTAIRYLVHQPWITAMDLQGLERIERMINRLAIEERRQAHVGGFD